MFKLVPGIRWYQAFGAGVIGLLISSAIVTATFYLGKGGKTADIQIINGEVVGKTREHGHYLRSYECNCVYRNECSGSGNTRTCTSVRTCQTCYEDRYTVTWSCQSNIGTFTIEHLDESRRSVYDTKDPQRYTIIQKGDPVSKSNIYKNYIKAVPQSIFRPAQETLKQQYALYIPKYPANIYDIYRIDRVLTVGANVPNLKEWNDRVSDSVKTLGPLKQANVVIVLTTISDPNYFYALQDAWVNGKKNDIIVVIGAPEFPKKAAWVNIMTLSKDSLFQVKLRDKILSLQELTAADVVNAIHTETMQTYQRKSMKDFKYLDAEIDPPTWLMVLCIFINIIAYVVFWYQLFTHRSKSMYNRFGTPKFKRVAGIEAMFRAKNRYR